MAITEDYELHAGELSNPSQSKENYASALHLGLIAVTIVFSLILISVATVNSALAQSGKPLHQAAQFAGQLNGFASAVASETMVVSTPGLSNLLSGDLDLR